MGQLDKETPITSPVIPDNPNWHRHKNACVYYRERWSAVEETGDEGCVLLYQIICLMNTPPQTPEEQAKCMRPRVTCWRLETEEALASETRVTRGRVSVRRGEAARVSTP